AAAPSTAPNGPPAAAPPARPAPPPMSDCFEPSARSSAQAYAGHAVTPPASAMPSTPARSLDVNVVMLSPVLFSAEPIVPGTATSSAREAAPLVMQKRHGGDDLWRNMAAGGDRLYWRPF